MADKIVPRDYTETAGVPAAARKEIWNPDTGVNEYVEHQKEFEDGLYLNSSRIAMQELTSNTIPSGGEYVIAIIDDLNNFQGISAEFMCEFGNSSLGCELAFVSSNVAKTHENTTIKLTKPSSNNLTGNRVVSFKLAKNDSSVTAGAKILAIIETSVTTLKLTTNMDQNVSRDGLKGCQLIEPTTTDNTKCPDGSAATFLEAGAELSLNVTNVTTPIFMGYRANSDDILNCSAIWPETPKQGTSLTITLPSTSLIFKSLNETNSAIVASHTISNFNIVGNIVEFRINQTGISTGMLDFAHAFVLITGSGFKLTIT